MADNQSLPISLRSYVGAPVLPVNLNPSPRGYIPPAANSENKSTPAPGVDFNRRNYSLVSAYFIKAYQRQVELAEQGSQVDKVNLFV
ncbi:MAG: hypothetical protein RDU59_06260 [Thermodesulfobacteriota bacterium]|nr:hypothetical protein [Desulfovibrionales bacterium]MDQ7838078.1 hypothetical protein [Thermodesulfobacteriota bacterium]